MNENEKMNNEAVSNPAWELDAIFESEKMLANSKDECAWFSRRKISAMANELRELRRQEMQRDDLIRRSIKNVERATNLLESRPDVIECAGILAALVKAGYDAMNVGEPGDIYRFGSEAERAAAYLAKNWPYRFGG